MGEFTLESQAFDDGDRIPEEYGYTETNVNPPLEIRGVPDDAETLALIVDDPDAIEPAGTVWDHWIVWNVPPETGTIPEDWDAADAIEGTNDFGERGYGGPNPPDREHTYRFRLFALETSLDLGPDAAAADLESTIEKHVLEQARLEGTYPA
ncbi:YbhB/YbcL family Raf kinase inhibitor-like protein [Natrinema gari]|uniref:Phosphatidylethanolamine-binding protein n=1 Tax=Natrinema gari JCM 14663 TaxID=1230459 RepID=L9Z9Q1_9EURY|nr:YbhB/YbcL family Raf kinase inhibitor-like protein [Natrinema gari]ELY83215.1 phosphatidylethanolamine-binding protein [Natrinema gari JCM 14663]